MATVFNKLNKNQPCGNYIMKDVMQMRRAWKETEEEEEAEKIEEVMLSDVLNEGRNVEGRVWTMLT